jgi:hypothetical protein
MRMCYIRVPISIIALELCAEEERSIWSFRSVEWAISEAPFIGRSFIEQPRS